MSDASVTMRAFALFDEALEQPEAARDRWLEATCGSDATLLREVRALLAAAGRTSGVLEQSPLAAPHLESRDALSAALHDGYVLGREIGRGGMATVYLARERKHDRDVVIKVLDPYVAHSCGADRFLREIRIAATLAHPHIVPLIDSGEAGDYLYYVMPWMEGETLRDRIRRGPPSIAEGVAILRDVAGALAFAHEGGVVHRDLKPENVLLTDGHAYLLDFGIAKLIDASAPSVSITSPGFALGTRRYMAPEQAAAADQVDSRADIYAWGVLGAELFSGQSLPAGPTHTSVPAVLARNAGMPRALVQLLTESVSMNPDRRPPSMAAVVQRLDAISASGSVPAITSRRRAPVLAVAVALVSAVAAGVYAWQRTPVADGLLAEPIAVSILHNETGDSALSVIGRFAGDWVTDGLQRMGGVQVVPWSQALLASQRATNGGASLVSTLHDEVKAGTVVTGSYYQLRDSLYLRAQLNDGRTGKLISTLAQIVFPVAQPEAGVRQLRDRVMGAVAAARDDRVFTQADLARTPPSFSAYQAFDEGFDRYLDQQYSDALTAFRNAYARDTTFSLALLFAARAAWNVDQYAVAESLITRARVRGRDLGVYHDASLRYLEALLEGNGERARAAIQRAAAIAPNSRAGFDHAAALLNAGYARAAREQLLQIDPDRGEIRGWSPYWTQRVHAAYLLGNHTEELDAAREMARRHPDRRVALVLEARALASMHNVRALDSAMVAWDSLPTNVYWSQGAAMVVAAEELLRRGREADGLRYAQRAVAWLSNRLVATPNDRAHRYWMGSVLYDMGDFQRARPYFEGLAREFPDRFLYSGLAAVVAARRGDQAAATRWLATAPARQTGDRLAYQARIAAIAGDTEQAVVLLTSAVDHGVEGYAWLPGAAFRDLTAVANDPRGRALLSGR